MKRILLTALLGCIFLPVGCTHSLFMDDELLKQEQVCLQVNDRLVYSYDENTDQLGYNPTSFQFRAGSDNMGTYFVATCSEKPVRKGQTLQVSLQWTEKGTVARKTPTMKVEKVSGNGYVWLWCRKEGISAVVRILE